MCWWLFTISRCQWLFRIINYICIDAFTPTYTCNDCWTIVTSWGSTCSKVRLDKQRDTTVVGGSMISISTKWFEICPKETKGLELESMGECQKICSSNLNLTGRWMITYNCLKLIRIADHNASLAFWIQLGSLLIMFMHIHNTTPNLQML